MQSLIDSLRARIDSISNEIDDTIFKSDFGRTVCY
jgi:hypothetical protein